LPFVDEIGSLPVGTGGVDLVFQLVNTRKEKGAMILISNRGFSKWDAVFGDLVVATELLDRQLLHAVVAQAARTPCKKGRPRSKLTADHQTRKLGEISLVLTQVKNRWPGCADTCFLVHVAYPFFKENLGASTTP